MATPSGARRAAAASTAPRLDQPLRGSNYVTAAVARHLRRLGIHTPRDLLFHLPRRYEDFSRLHSLAELREKPPEGPVSAVVELVELRVEAGFRRRVQRTVARLRDETGEGEAVWFGRRYIERRLNAGQHVALSGKVELRGWLPRFQNPEFGVPGEDALHAGRIVPIYRLTAGVSAAVLRRAIHRALEEVLPQYDEYLPAELREAAGGDLPEIDRAISWAHFPDDQASLERALGRLAFDELFSLQLGMVARRRRRQVEISRPVEVAAERFAEALAKVEAVIAEQVAARRDGLAGVTGGVERPADGQADAVVLTADQRAAIEQIRDDLASERPMMLLLQGDVGSGKTAVAALALAFVADSAAQAALLAPTDLLARQHAQTLTRLLEPLGHGVTLLTGSLPMSARREAHELLAAPPGLTITGQTRGRLVVGTHALVQEGVTFADLRLVVVDEQHRFGVAQREALAAKGSAPHVLLMTATPIPRTLSQIVHADLDVSDLRSVPVGRRQVTTAVRRTSELVRRADGKPGALALICRQVAAGRRAFVIVPLVEEDEESGATSVEQAAALVRDGWVEAARLAGIEAGEPGLEVVHGQLKAAQRDERMERFRRGDISILVGTTVLEVGVDVPEATVMLILDADRFGLAQLHQLRGRVGRGDDESFCVLVSERYPHGKPLTDEEAAVKARLDALSEHHDGFKLAELDLEQRREGELLGLSQSGLPPLRVATLSGERHRRLSLRARELAEEVLDDTGRLPPRLAALEAELTTGWLKRVGAGEVLGEGAQPGPDQERAAAESDA